MKIAIAQINVTVGDFEGNSARIIKDIERAERSGAELVVFPEMAITGYPTRDLLEKPHFVSRNLGAVDKIAEKCRNIAAIVGFVSKNKSETGKGLFNSAAFICGGKIKFVQHKSLLPTYDVFDETRHFEPASSHKIFPYNGEKMGITICEDVWSGVNIEGRRLYHYDPIAKLAKAGAKTIINISASPFYVGKQGLRKELLSKTARKYKVPIIYVNAVGGNDELVFDGRSLVVNKSGKIAHECKGFEEDFYVTDTTIPLLCKEGLGEVDSNTSDLYRALTLGLSDYVKKCGFRKAVLGLSGGIDSCVVAALAADAIGPENVTGIAMPSPYSSKESVTDAELLAKNLGIEFKVIPITDIYNSYLNIFSVNLRTYAPFDLAQGRLTNLDTSLENIQARIRGNILMAISNKTGALVLSTGNKSEVAVGYCTLYGDMAGGLSIISDVPKTFVYKLADYINRDGEIIPRSSILKPPSAELRPNQKDTDSLPPYDILDPILKLYIEGHLDEETIIKNGFDRKIVGELIRRIDGNEYKRRQAPPGLKVTSKSFGSGRRYPIAWKF